MRVHRFDNAPRPLAWLPNREGFRFTGVRKDGTECPCMVMRHGGGMHFIQGADFIDLKGWKPLPVTQTQGMWI